MVIIVIVISECIHIVCYNMILCYGLFQYIMIHIILHYIWACRRQLSGRLALPAVASPLALLISVYAYMYVYIYVYTYYIIYMYVLCIHTYIPL